MEWMRGVLDEMSPAEKAEALDQIAEDGGDKLAQAVDPKTVDDMIQKALADRDAKAAEEAKTQAFIGQVKDKAKELADKYGVDDFGNSESVLYRVLLSEAGQIKGDKIVALEKAAEQVMGQIDRAAQKMMSKKTAGAAGPAVSQKGSEPGGRSKPMTLEDAKRSAMERLSPSVGI